MNTPAKPANCDLVLEGGVTSAVVYAGFVAELSRHYRFVQLGGASSGSLAAAAAAIAQRAKLKIAQDNFENPESTRSPHEPFDELGKFASTMAQTGIFGRTRLLDLFQPQPKTRRGFQIVEAWLRHRLEPGWTWLVKVLWACVANFPLAALIGAVIGAVIACAIAGRPAATWPQSSIEWLALVAALVLMLFLALLVAVGWTVVSVARGLRGNLFGLCNGMPTGGYPDDHGALTPAMHQLFNKLLGKEPEDEPVVFGQLWGNRPGKKREIDLQVVTTAVNLQRPFRIPGEPDAEPLAGFFYDADEWALLFPEPVMQWLREKTALPLGTRVYAHGSVSPQTGHPRGRELLALPPMRGLPVVVAVRMSVAFPGLLSAVPMYTVDGDRGRHIDPPRADGTPGETWFVASKVWFADGGITSNCPVHLFDAPLPRHPTFAIRLGKLGDDEPDTDRIWLHGDAKPTPPARVGVPNKLGALDLVFWFVSSIVLTAVNWRDTLQTELPGYRERIVTVKLKEDEGGINLLMPSTMIIELSKLGTQAATRLHASFAGTRVGGQANRWDTHRWTRLRSTLAAAQGYLRQVNRLDDEERRAYLGLLVQTPSLDPRLPDKQAQDHAQALLNSLLALEPKVPEPAPPPLTTPTRADGKPIPGPSDPAFQRPDLGTNEPEPAPRLRMTSPW